MVSPSHPRIHLSAFADSFLMSYTLSSPPFPPSLSLPSTQPPQDCSLLHVTGKTKDLLPLHVACLGEGSEECSAAQMVELLISAGARVNDLDAQGRSALTLCRQDNKTRSAKAVNPKPLTPQASTSALSPQP